MVFKRKHFAREWSSIAMLELQHIRFAGWALTGGQHRLKAGKKKKTHKVGLFFWFPLRFSDASSRSGLTDFSPHSNIYLSIYRHSFQYITSGSTAPGASPGQSRAGRVQSRSPGPSDEKVSLAKRSSLNFEIFNLNFSLFNARNFKLLRVQI